MDEIPITAKFKELGKVNSKGVRFADATGAVKHYSYAELMNQAGRVANGLRMQGIQPGDPVILVMTNPQAAILAILGCMMLGCPPTPVYPPLNLQAVPGFLRFIKHVAERSTATMIIAEGQTYSFLGSISHQTKTVRNVLRFETLIADGCNDDSVDPENPVAFLQFTSGSTSDPKGVLVSHRGLAANLWMIRQASHMSESSSVVTWLPVYHDMGLIGTVLNAITLPCDLVVLPPIVFLKKPRLWLELITEHHGTHTAAPNFAYGICARRISDVSGLNLSSMTTFICGAEPVLPATMEKFVEHFQPAGLEAGALVPAYGLAEATLAVTFTPFLRGLKSDRVDLAALSESRFAKPVNGEDSHSVWIASCGEPMPGLSVRVATEDGAPLADREVGEVQVSGPSVTPGYIGDEHSTRNSRTSDGWLKTGDLGYFVNGELYVCGRSKDVIIIRGKKFHAHDLESIASEVPGIRTGNVVAFSSAKQNGEALVLIAETRKGNHDEPLGRNVRNRLSESIGISPDEVVIVPAGTLPKTSSGKLKRLETKRLFETGKLHSRPGKVSAYLEAMKSGFGFLLQKIGVRGN
ncbi:fatty acyl-AMP ligase [bacterium]|nr:fatty acyl-AMP ligase [bacterium]MCI0602178.1 fatty acyl-AMP ligase [bacterium]